MRRVTNVTWILLVLAISCLGQIVTPCPQTNGYVYGGAPLMTGAVTNYPVYYGNWDLSTYVDAGGVTRWNNNDDGNYVDLFRDLADGIGYNAQYSGFQNQWCDANGNHPGYPALWVDQYNKPTQLTDWWQGYTNITDSVIQARLVSFLQNNQMPRNTNGIYVVYLSKEITITDHPNQCAYHSYFPTSYVTGTNSSGYFKYAVIMHPDNPQVGYCNYPGLAYGSPNPVNGSVAPDAMASFTVHENGETVTDQTPGVQLGWYVPSTFAETWDQCTGLMGAYRGTAPNGSTYDAVIWSRMGTTPNYRTGELSQFRYFTLATFWSNSGGGFCWH